MALIVRHVVDIHRAHRGIFRAAHFDSARSQLYWPQLHAFGRRLADSVHQALHAHLLRVPARQRRLRVGVALPSWSMARWSTRCCMTPDSSKLADKQIEAELTRVFLAPWGSD